MSNNLLFNAELITRYDKSGPRYTSYPTAAQFSEEYNETDYMECVKDSNSYLIPLPLSLYIHLPFCNTVCYYCACNKIITNNHNRALPYLENLYKEIRLQSALLDPDRQVTQLHLGGGTPTFIGHDNLRKLVEVLKQNFNFNDGDEGEYSIEIDPREVDDKSIPLLRELGFNRISIGVQDFDPDVQIAVNRIQTLEQTADVIKAARSEGFKSSNIDLIYGLPLQTRERFQTTLEQVINLRPDRIALYSYAHLPHLFKTQKQINQEHLPSAAEKLSILQHSINRLTQNDYIYIGMDHFALPEDDLAIASQNGTLHRNFQGYSTHAECDIVGMGITAISSIAECYSQNVRTLEEYDYKLKGNRIPIFKGIKLTEDDTLRREVIMQLICQFKLNYSKIEDHYAIDFRRYFCSELLELKLMENDGLIKLEKNRMSVLPAGRLLVRNICKVFDIYSNKSPVTRFSNSI